MVMRKLLAKTSSLKEENSGHVAVIAALSIIPILTVAGFAVDFQLVTTKKTQVQFAMDSAVIAGARAMQAGKSENEIKATIQNYIQALADSNEGGMSCNEVSVTFGEQTQDISASVLCSQPTTLSAVVGKTHLDFRINSASTYGIGKLDVAFIFDSSGSMGWDGRLEDLKDASALAIEELLPDGSNENGDIRIAMAAYNHMVNAGDYFPDVVESTTYSEENSYWLTYDGGSDCWYWGWWQGRQYWYCTTIQEFPINHTCVYERQGDEAFTAATPGEDAWLEVTGGNVYWADDCPPSEPLPLTTSKSDLLNYIDDLTAAGGTAGHQGVAWGWYLIAPEWANIWPAESEPLAYDEPDSAKALIMMTDGSFNSYNGSGQGNSVQQAEDLCDNMKDAGVVIYSVAFQAPSSGQAILNYCASGPEFFFDPSTGQELEDSYRAIATSISDLRISQ